MGSLHVVTRRCVYVNHRLVASGSQATARTDLEVLDELVGVMAEGPEVDDPPSALHQQELIEGLR